MLTLCLYVGVAPGKATMVYSRRICLSDVSIQAVGNVYCMEGPSLVIEANNVPMSCGNIASDSHLACLHCFCPPYSEQCAVGAWVWLASLRDFKPYSGGGAVSLNYFAT